MADDRNNPDLGRNAGMGDQGGQNQQAPGRNPEGGQTGQRTEDRGQTGGKDQGLGKGQEGNRNLNEGGFEKGGQEKTQNT